VWGWRQHTQIEEALSGYGVGGKPYDLASPLISGGNMSTQNQIEEKVSEQLLTSVNTLVAVANTVHTIQILRAKAKDIQKIVSKTEEYQQYISANKKFREKYEAWKSTCPEYQAKVQAFAKVVELKEYQEKRAINKEIAQLRKKMIEDALKAYEMLPPEWKVQ
jgi:Cys-tRNA synthase (O-phospho-L-seryl-tRNA:Cys-tRNA synthase)